MRKLTPEEKKLWKKIAETVEPLTSPVREEVAERSEAGEGNSIPAIGFTPTRPAMRATLPPHGGGKPLAPGDFSHVDGSVAARLKKGEYLIDAQLDLHGMDRGEAQRALAGFLGKSYEQGRRCLLIITGKGAPGVLRGLLPAWLNEPGTRERVLAFTAAQARHGGGGAFYVLLKRKR